MDQKFVFVDRRQGRERRLDSDPCRELPVDLYHRKRRKKVDRRDGDKTLTDDYYAFMEAKLRTEHSETAEKTQRFN